MAVAAATDNRCVGGGNGVSDSPTAVMSSIPASATTSDGRNGKKNSSRNSIGGSGYTSSSPPLSSDEDDGHEGADTVVRGGVAEFGGRGAVVVQPPPVAAKRLKYLQQHVVDLDDLELLDRHLTAAEDTMPPDANADCTATSGLVDELKQKTKDLVLAARLGKALLAKNDELSLMNERLAEEYGDKLEEIEQDRHRLRRQLAQARSECEQRCHELQADLKDLQAVLDNRERQLREAEKQKRLVVRELTDQNGRLQSHIRELSQAEAELQNKCRLLEDTQQPQHASGKWNNIVGIGSPSSMTNGGSTTDYGSLTPDDYRSLDVLRDEIDMKAAEKQRLQKRIAELRADRDRLSELLELKDRQLVECRSEANHYEHRSAMLAKQLDDALCSGGSDDWKTRGKCVSCQGSTTGTTTFRMNGNEESQPMSLLAELEQAEAAKSQTVVQSGPPQMVDVDLTQRSNFESSEVDAIERLAIRLCDMLEQQRHSDPGARILELSADIRYRLMKLIGGDGPSGFIVTGDKTSDSNDLAEQIRNRDGRVAELMCELSVRDAELQASREERDIAIRDKMDAMRIQCARCGNGNSENENADEKNNSSLIPELLRKAWEQRDGAVRRKNSVQVQLARTRVDVLQANGQLMEAIGQKVELSQQLEQWQTDMQCLLDEQMRRKLLPQSSINGSSECEGGGNQKKFSATNGGGGFSSMTASSLGSLGSSSLMNSLLMIAGGGNTNR